MPDQNVPDYKKIEVKNLIPYANNSRTHSDEQVAQIAASIKEFGFTNPVLIDGEGGIIAGHGRVMAARKLGLDEVPCIVLSHLSEAQKKAYIIADNQLPLNAGWDLDMLRVEIENLQEMDFDLDLLGFDSEFISDIYDFEPPEPESGLSDENNPYNQNIEAPTYEAKNEKPDMSELVSYSYHDKLVEKIKRSNVTADEKSFLLSAAERHSVFNFSKIADYYAHSDMEMQELMEDSALVIIDYDKAMENGFIHISKGIAEQHALENPEDE